MRISYHVEILDYGDITIRGFEQGGAKLIVQWLTDADKEIDLTQEEGEELLNALSLSLGRGEIEF